MVPFHSTRCYSGLYGVLKPKSGPYIAFTPLGIFVLFLILNLRRKTIRPDPDAFLSIIFSRQQLRDDTAFIPPLNIFCQLFV